VVGWVHLYLQLGGNVLIKDEKGVVKSVTRIMVVIKFLYIEMHCRSLAVVGVRKLERF
jgi:hypothetical protein